MTARLGGAAASWGRCSIASAVEETRQSAGREGVFRARQLPGRGSSLAARSALPPQTKRSPTGTAGRKCLLVVTVSSRIKSPMPDEKPITDPEKNSAVAPRVRAVFSASTQ